MRTNAIRHEDWLRPSARSDTLETCPENQYNGIERQVDNGASVPSNQPTTDRILTDQHYASAASRPAHVDTMNGANKHGRTM